MKTIKTRNMSVAEHFAHDKKLIKESDRLAKEITRWLKSIKEC